ncbi:MAG: molybdenum cofactor guanylyltransferase [Actinobacteria bacterium]|nr:molybdenum cofactor guanylyltransferase [Actinomycetota bacterium]
MTDTPVAAAVLTGGASRRMGRDKALVEVDGAAMVHRVVAAVVGAGCSPVITVGGDAAALATVLADTEADVAMVPDRFPGEGPLGAILTALRHLASPAVVVATDLAWLDAATVERLLVHRDRLDADVVMARSDRAEHLCALWWPSAAPALERRFAAGERAIHRALDGLRLVEVAVPTGAVRNVNTPTDLGRTT